jgi:hypothetical protein
MIVLLCEFDLLSLLCVCRSDRTHRGRGVGGQGGSVVLVVAVTTLLEGLELAKRLSNELGDQAEQGTGQSNLSKHLLRLCYCKRVIG